MVVGVVVVVVGNVVVVEVVVVVVVVLTGNATEPSGATRWTVVPHLLHLAVNE